MANTGRSFSSPLGLANFSVINMFSPPSTSSDDQTSPGTRRAGTLDHNRRIVNEIINDIFDDRAGNVEVSSSHCSSIQRKASEYSFDRRLKYWKNVLEDRKKLGENIRNKTGKQSADLLFNRMTTVDERDKQTVKRLLDYAERMHPLAVMNRKVLKLRGYDDMEKCVHVHELRETLPKSVQDGSVKVEVSGLPAATKEELLGKRKFQGVEKKFNWLKSRVLERRIEDKHEDIERVIEHYPDIEHLQVIGESLTKSSLLRHNSDIEFLAEEPIQRISSDTSLCAAECEDKKLDEEPQQCDYSLKVNDHVFQLLTKRSSKNVEVELRFECKPFEKVIKRVLHLENLGKKVLNCEWAHRPYYEKNGQLLKATDEEFVFDRRPFRLISGETRDVIVQFQPRRADIVMEKWMLKVDPQFFCRKVDAIVVKLNGKCVAPPEYLAKINGLMTVVVDKSNLKMMRKLTQNLGSLTPLIRPPDRICPYKRTLSERELFEFYNIGYRCDRYHDLELLKDLHRRVKKPREPMWDLKLDTLKSMIFRFQGAEQRALLFAELTSVLEEMRGMPVELETRIEDNPERDRARMVYVRGIISTGIDEWEDLAFTIEQAFLKTALKEYYDLLAEEETLSGDGASKSVSKPNPIMTPRHRAGTLRSSNPARKSSVRKSSAVSRKTLDEEEIKLQLTKDLRHRKAFRDTLYVQTYTHLCNFIEDIVSVIESTDVI